MNRLRIFLIIPFFGILSGCRGDDKYDVAESQVKKKDSQMEMDFKDNSNESAKVDLGGFGTTNHKDGHITIPKGSKLPDGSIAKEDTQFRVETDDVGHKGHWGKTSAPDKK